MSLDSHINIGIITSAHGIKGHVKIKTFTETPQDIESFKTIFNHTGKTFHIKIRSVKPSFVIAEIQGINTRNQAEDLRNTNLYITRADLPEPTADEYYHEDLMNLEVQYTTGAIAGKIKSIENFGAGDIIEISNHGKSFYYPFNRNFVQEVDLKNRIVIIEHMEEIPAIEQPCFIITVDGPSAAGKGTIARRLADRLGFHYLDTGMMYRILGYHATKNNITFDKVKELVKLAKEINYSVEDGQIDYKTEEVGTAASKVAQIPEVRKVLNRLQKNFPIGKIGVVIDGRDIGSVIFPDAPCKLYVTASSEVRAQRRFAEMQKDNSSTTLEMVKEKLQERDERDSMRSVSPLVVPADAVVIDTSALTIEESCELAYKKASLAMENTFA